MLFAQNINYPTEDISYISSDIKSGKEFLAITQSMINEAEGRWNTITIQLPEGIPYQPNLALRGMAQIESTDVKPTHVGVLLMCANGEEGFAKVPVRKSGAATFELLASEFVPGSKSANNAPLTEKSVITAIRIYASYPQETQSTFTLESFSMNYEKELLDVSADYTSGEEFLTLPQPITNEATGRWSVAVIQPPDEIPYQPKLIFRGQAEVKSTDIKPTHVGITLIGTKDEEGFAKVPVGPDGAVSFEVPASEFVAVSRPENKGPLTEESSIKTIRIYASYPQETKSTFTLESFSMSYEEDWSPLEAAKRRNAHLLEGSMVIPERWANVHPRLYASAEDLEQTALRYQEDPAFLEIALPADDGPEMTGPLLRLEEGGNAHRIGIYLAKLAVAYRVTNNEAYLARLRDWMPTLKSYEPPAMGSIGDNIGLNAGHVLLGCSIAYDVLVGQGDEELEDVLLDVILRQGKQTFEDIISLRTFPYEQNHLIIPVCGLAVASMTLADSYPEAEEWGVLADNIMERALTAIAHDGWYHEGFWYWNYTMQFPTSYAVAKERVMGQQVLDAPCFKLAPEYISHMTLPNPRFVFDFADWGPRVEPDGVGFQQGYDWPWHTLHSRLKKFVPVLLLREDPENSLLRNYLDHYDGKEGMTGIHTIDAVYEMLIPASSSEGQPSSDTTDDTYPPYHYFPDMEVVHWRNNWEDPNATAIAFKSGPPAGHHFGEIIEGNPEWKPSLGHAHPDAGSFIIFGQGVFLANDAGYTGAKETANHNAILVDGIGQHKGGTPWNTFLGKPYSEYDKIHMEDVWMGPHVMAATAVYQAAYDDAMMLETMRRTLILIDGRFLVILDELSSELPHEYEWRWHSDQPAEVAGAGRYVMTNGSGRVVIESLNEVAAEKVAPTIVETNIYPQNPSRPQQRGFHLSLVSPRQKDFEFLTAACIQSASESPDSFQVIESSDRMVRLSDGTRECTVWFAGNASLDGSFAYMVRGSSGQIEAVGLSGKSLRAGSLLIELESPGSVSAERDASGSWMFEPADCAVTIQVAE